MQGYGEKIFDQYIALFGKWYKPYLLWNANKKLYPSFRMVPFWMTLSDLWPGFQGHDNIQRSVEHMHFTCCFVKSRTITFSTNRWLHSLLFISHSSKLPKTLDVKRGLWVMIKTAALFGNFVEFAYIHSFPFPCNKSHSRSRSQNTPCLFPFPRDSHEKNGNPESSLPMQTSRGLQVAGAKLREIGHHAQLVDFRLAHLCWLYQLHSTIKQSAMQRRFSYRFCYRYSLTG